MEFLQRAKRKREIKRLESIKDLFLQDYVKICLKYKAHLIPLITQTQEGFKVIQQLDSYAPLSETQKQTIKENKVNDNGTPEQKQPEQQ